MWRFLLVVLIGGCATGPSLAVQQAQAPTIEENIRSREIAGERKALLSGEGFLWCRSISETGQITHVREAETGQWIALSKPLTPDPDTLNLCASLLESVADRLEDLDMDEKRIASDRHSRVLHAQLDDAESQLARQRAVQAAIQGVGDSFTAKPRRASVAGETAPGRSLSGECSSDFSCGSGYSCVKPNYSSSGTCMRAVDSTGVPTFKAPRTDSIGPNLPSGSDCNSLGHSCPAGFRCDGSSGACVR